MTAQEAVIALYRAYASRAPSQIAALLHPLVVWVAPNSNATQVALGLGRPEDAGPPDGSNNLRLGEIVNFMANEFRCIMAEQDRVVAEHRLSATLPNGKPYTNDYCSCTKSRLGSSVRRRSADSDVRLSHGAARRVRLNGVQRR
jgi:uncharacterized protein